MMIERHKMTRATYQALKRYIMRERERKKQEQEQDKAQERLRKEREMQKKKEEEDSLTLEQTKEQLVQLEAKLDALKQEKHGLFSELKKVLHQENEMRQRAQIQEKQSEMALQQQHIAAGIQQPVPGHPIFLQSNIGVTRPPSKYLNVASHQPIGGQGIKRSRSPSPPPQAVHFSSHFTFPPTPPYGAASGAPAGSSGGSQGSIKQEPYCAPKPASYGTTYGQPSGHAGFPGQQAPPSQSAQSNQQYPGSSSSQSVPGGPGSSVKYPPGAGPPPPSQSAFTTYPAAGYSIYQAAKAQPAVDQYAGYSRQPALPPRRTAPPSGYMSPHHGPVTNSGPPSIPPLQQQLEHASQKAGFVDEKFKAHAQQVALLAVQQQQQQQQQSSLAGLPPPRGSAYTIRAPPQPGPPTSVYSSGQGQLAPPRHSNHGPSRY